jgi:hypothetical protein
MKDELKMSFKPSCCSLFVFFSNFTLGQLSFQIKMVLPRFVPFIDWDEWLQLMNYLYSDDINLILKGIDIVAMWNARGKLPHSIESTSHLLQVRVICLN